MLNYGTAMLETVLRLASHVAIEYRRCDLPGRVSGKALVWDSVLSDELSLLGGDMLVLLGGPRDCFWPYSTGGGNCNSTTQPGSMTASQILGKTISPVGLKMS